MSLAFPRLFRRLIDIHPRFVIVLLKQSKVFCKNVSEEGSPTSRGLA